MEAREGMNPGVPVTGAEAPSAYHMAPRPEVPSQYAGPAAVDVSPVNVGLAGTSEKKKRGRPRKYPQDGSVPTSLSPMFNSSGHHSGVSSSGKRGKSGLSAYERRQQQKMAMESSGDWDASPMGTSFKPHVINVNAGEDVTMKIISFAQQGPRAICIMAATGAISNVTIRQLDSSGGTLTYEGRFEILSLTGSFLPSESQGTKSRSGGMSVTLASPDGRIVGGGVAGLLVAASQVQVVVGSFLVASHPEPKPRKQKNAFSANDATVTARAGTTNIDFQNGMVGGYAQPPTTTTATTMSQNQNLASPSFQRDNSNWTTMQEPRNSTTDINIPLPAT